MDIPITGDERPVDGLGHLHTLPWLDRDTMLGFKYLALLQRLIVARYYFVEYA